MRLQLGEAKEVSAATATLAEMDQVSVVVQRALGSLALEDLAEAVRACGEASLECSELADCVKFVDVLSNVHAALERKDVAGVRETAVVARESGLQRAPVARQAQVFVEDTQPLVLSIKLML